MSFDANLIKDWKTSYTNVSLSNLAYYTTRINIEYTPLLLTTKYNPRNKQRWVTVTDLNGAVLLSQTFIKYGRRCEMNFNANQYDLSHYLTLRPKDSTKEFSDDYDYLNWADDFILCFVGHSNSLNERFSENKRSVLVSG